MRRHLSYANVTATIALVVALATGGAYAADLIGSDEIRDNSIRSEDLRDRRAVRGKDVLRNSLGGREIDESRLGAAQFIEVSSDRDLACSLESAFTECATASVRLARRGKIVATATGAYFGNGMVPSSALCELRLDGVGESSGQTPGETDRVTDSLATDGFARTHAFSNVNRGLHEVGLACREVEGQATIGTSTVLALAITNR